MTNKETKIDGEIKPCPFCGEPAEVHQSPPSLTMPIWYVGCDGKNGCLCPGYAYKVSPYYSTKELAIKMWNSRPQKNSKGE